MNSSVCNRAEKRTRRKLFICSSRMVEGSDQVGSSVFAVVLGNLSGLPTPVYVETVTRCKAAKAGCTLHGGSTILSFQQGVFSKFGRVVV